MIDVESLLHRVRNGELSVEEAAGLLKQPPCEDLDYAKLDHHRRLRTGFGEVVFCPGKTPEQVREIFCRFDRCEAEALGTRASREQFEAVREALPETLYDPVSRLLRLRRKPVEPRGLIAVCTGGTTDIPVAEEAAQTAEFFGCRVLRVYDVGVAGIHRLLSRIREINQAHAIVAVAGMEGALGSVIAGLSDKPVIAVPTSVGYGANLGGVAALLTMLNSCAEGLAVVNIDNGFGAGYLAAQINRLAIRHEP